MSLRLALLSSACLALVACGQKEEVAEPTAPQPVEEVKPVFVEEVKKQNQNDALLAMADQHAKAFYAYYPEWSTSFALTEEYAGQGAGFKLSQRDTSTMGAKEQTLNQFLEDVRDFRKAELTGTALVTRDVLNNAYRLASRRNEFLFGDRAMLGATEPYWVTQLSGAHVEFPRLMLIDHPLNNFEDAKNFSTRLNNAPLYFHQTTSQIEQDAGVGVVPPEFAIQGVQNTIKFLTQGNAADHAIIKRLEAALAEMDAPASDKEALVLQATEGLTATFAAMQEMGDALYNLRAQAPENAGIWHWEDGAEFYQLALDNYGANGRDADEVHEIGVAEVKRITTEMNVIMDDLGILRGDGEFYVGARFAALANSQMQDGTSMLYPNDDAGRATLLADLEAQVNEIDAIAPQWFKTLPKEKVVVKRIPIYEQDSSAGGYYTQPALDGSRPGTYWINLKDTRDWPKHTLKTLTYHEAIPGHHFQIALQQEIEDLPMLRKTTFYSDYGEGWAMYGEKLAAEMGMYENDPYGDLGRLQSELFRAARLVVDTGLHHKKWTREEAIDYMVEVTGDTRPSITREIERYAVWPGQATSYKLGMIAMEEFRAKAESELGDKFDIRAYHDFILLNGAVPIPVLSQQLDEWIESQR